MKAFTGTAPFDLHLSITVAIAIMRGERPLRPTNPALTNGLWALMQYCWSQDPFSRPDMPQVLRVLHSPSVIALFHHHHPFVNLVLLLCLASPLGLPHADTALFPIRGQLPRPLARNRPSAMILDPCGGSARAGDEPSRSCPHTIPPCDDAKLGTAGVALLEMVARREEILVVEVRVSHRSVNSSPPLLRLAQISNKLEVHPAASPARTRIEHSSTIRISEKNTPDHQARE